MTGVLRAGPGRCGRSPTVLSAVPGRDGEDSSPSRRSNEYEFDLLDDTDRGILFELQRDARNVTIAEIAETVGVSSSTVRNRIERLEEAGVIEGYYPKIDYEAAAFPLHVLFICSAQAAERERLAREALESRGVVDIREMLTSTHNLYVEAVATDTRDLTAISNDLAELGFVVESSEIITNHYTRPWAHFEYDTDME